MTRGWDFDITYILYLQEEKNVSKLKDKVYNLEMEIQHLKNEHDKGKNKTQILK